MNILLTSVGRRSYLVNYFKEALNGKGEIHVANSTDLSPAFNVADFSIVTPIIYDDKYIDFLLKYCIDHSIQAIISLFDIDLFVLSRNKERFEKIGVRIIVSNTNVIEICNDKWETYKFLLENGFNTPKTYLTLKKAIEDIDNHKVSYPLIVKPRWGMGSISVYEADNEEELKVFFTKIKKEILKSYLSYESKTDYENCILIQEKLNGQEYGLDVINDLDGNFQSVIPKLKYAMRSGETDCAVTVENESLKNIGEKISVLLKHVANLDVDVFVVDKKIYILEMNARFGGGYPFSHIAGVNLPLAIINWLRGYGNQKELLNERTNIIVHKDINLTRLYLCNDTKIIVNNNPDTIRDALFRLGNKLNPTLCDLKINIDRYSKKLSEKAMTWIVQNQKGENVGILSSYVNDKITKTAYIAILVLNENYRGMNIARNLLKRLEKYSEENGIKKIKLEVYQENKNAISFYKKKGYNISKAASDVSYYMVKKL